MFGCDGRNKLGPAKRLVMWIFLIFFVSRLVEMWIQLFFNIFQQIIDMWGGICLVLENAQFDINFNKTLLASCTFCCKILIEIFDLIVKKFVCIIRFINSFT